MNGFLSLAFAAAALQVAAPPAEPSPLAGAFGNTVISTYADGRHQWLWLQADGGWAGIARDGKAVSGRWTFTKDGRVCLRQMHPPTLPFSYCTRLPTMAAIGTHWAAKDILGRPIDLELVGGVRRSVDETGAEAPAQHAKATPAH